MTGKHPPRGFRGPWLALTLAFAAHVADEALTDFLALYNPAVLRLREQVPWLPLPTFSFELWISLLALAVVVLGALTPLAGPGAWGLVIVGRCYAATMLLNGAAHLTASALAQTWLSGSVSSPLLITAATWLWVRMPSVAAARHRRDVRIHPPSVKSS